MKSTGYWSSYGSGTNSSGFSGFAGGYRLSDGFFENIGFYGKWWSSTEVSTDYAWLRYLNYDEDKVLRSNNSKKHGYSVRCLRD